MPIGYNKADRIQTPKALCNRPVSDNQEDQIQFQRPKALCVQTPFAPIEPGGRSTSNSERPSTLCWQHHRRSLPLRAELRILARGSAGSARPACVIPRPRQLVYRFVDVRQSRRTFGRKEASLSPPPLDRLEPVRGELCQPLSARSNGNSAIVSLDLQQ